MALQLDQMLLPMRQLSPLKGLDMGGGKSLERQQLALMRQKFEEEKRRNLEDEKLRQLELEGRMTQERLRTEREREQAEALAAAKLREQQEAAYGDVYKNVDVNDFSGTEMAGQRLAEHGGVYEDMGQDEQGRPSFRVAVNAEEDRAREAALAAQAAPTALAPGQTDESLMSSLNRLNALGYDQANRGRVDMGANMDSRRAQAQPVLDALVNAYPEGPRRESARRVGEGAGLLGLSPKGIVGEFNTLTSQPGAAVESGLAAERDADKAERTAELARSKEDREAERDRAKEARAAAIDAGKQAETRSDRGLANARTKWTSEGLNKIAENEKRADTITEMLTNKEKLDDSQTTHMFVRLKESIGAQSDKEVLSVFTPEDMSLKEKWMEKVRNLIHGGQAPAVKKAMLRIVELTSGEDDERVFKYLDSLDRVLDDPNTSEEEKRGWRKFRAQIDKRRLEAWDEGRVQDGEPTFEESEKRRTPVAPPNAADVYSEESDTPDDDEGDADDSPEGAAVDGDFLRKLYAADGSKEVDPEKLLQIIRPESNGDPKAKNKMGSSARGIPQFTNRTAQSFTNPRTGKKFKDADEFATLTTDEQIPIMMKYVARSGVNKDSPVEDYALAFAAPSYVGRSKKRDMPIFEYRSGTEFGDATRRDNPGWVPEGGGEITVGSILDFYRKHGMGKAKTAAKPKATDESVAAAYEAAQAKPAEPAYGTMADVDALDEEEAEDAEDGTPDAKPVLPRTKAGRSDAKYLQMLE